MRGRDLLTSPMLAGPCWCDRIKLPIPGFGSVRAQVLARLIHLPDFSTAGAADVEYDAVDVVAAHEAR